MDIWNLAKEKLRQNEDLKSRERLDDKNREIYYGEQVSGQKRGSQRDHRTGVHFCAKNTRKRSSASIVLVLDLTRPYELWITMEALMSAASSYAETAIRNLSESGQAKIRNRMTARISEYKNFDSEQRRKICCTLRFIAHYYGAHLMFYSCYNEQLVKLGRGLFSHLAFGTSASKGKVDDHNRPMYVTSGMDSFEAIGPPPTDTASFSRAAQPIHLWKNAFCDHFNQKDREITDKSGDEQQLFLEPMIDNLVAQREKASTALTRDWAKRSTPHTYTIFKVNFLTAFPHAIHDYFHP
ncbi:hypothetical protein TELCIR_03809 [Teladorsagia circumcincta]|uniref:Uncharacterized protein n=1 Tax=Teladorsagia circumcincta TaxID=45464 RepID=A0A2G9UVA5_TELCI|nr:hypothetical protein TELCIR_03809 [Teladorsagia circumcincta]